MMKVISMKTTQMIYSDEYDKTSFADLLGMLGIETDIDWADPFGSM